MKSISAIIVAIVIVLVLIQASTARVTINSDGFNSNQTVFPSDVEEMVIYAEGQSFHTKATHHNFDMEKNEWKLGSGLACSTWYGGETKEWGAKYGWVAFCLASQEPTGKDICGQCVRVEKIGGDYITTRVVDQCSKPDGGLVLDYKNVFVPIDKNDRSGEESGEIPVEYHFVSCYQ